MTMTGKRQVLFLCEFPTVLGGEQSLAALCAELPGLGWQPRVVCPAGQLQEFFRGQGIPTVCWPPAWQETPSGARPALMAATIATERPAVVHANSLSMAVQLGFCAPEVECCCVGHCRDIMKLSRRKLGALGCLDRVVTVSEATRANLLGQGLEPACVETIYNGIDTSWWHPDRIPAGQLRRELGVTEHIPIIGTIGQICLRKDQETFLRALARVAPARPDALAVIIGQRYSEKDESLRYEALCHELAAASGLRVEFLGYRSDVAALMRDLDVLVNSSRQEPLGRTIIEAMALGVPVVATDVGGSGELLAAGQCGLLVPTADVTAVAAAIGRLLSDPAHGSELARRARQRVEEIFSIQQHAARVADLYQRLFDADSEL